MVQQLQVSAEGRQHEVTGLVAHQTAAYEQTTPQMSLATLQLHYVA